MEYAVAFLPDTPPGGVTAGIDWASADHAVCVVDAAGVVVIRFTVEHTAAGLAALVRALARAGACEAAIERGDGPVVDALLAAGVTVVVITPRQVKNLRSRYGSAGNKDDRFDAFVLADVLRTDRARLRPLTAGSAATVTLRQACRARKDLVRHRVAVGNQLRAHLQSAFPGAAGLFSKLDSAISLAFLARFGCQDRAGWLSEKRLAAWLKSAGYSGRTDPAVLYQRLSSAPRGATGAEGAASAQVTRALTAVLASLNTQITALETQIAAQLAAHADSHIFTSLPRSGTVRAARLLTEIGDCRARFPDPESLICLAGAAPSTRQSGKHKAVTFRWAVSKQRRDAVCDFADGSRHANAWAAQIYNAAIARGKDHPHAVRILARASPCLRHNQPGRLTQGYSFVYVRNRSAHTTQGRRPRSRTLLAYAGLGRADLESVWGQQALTTGSRATVGAPDDECIGLARREAGHDGERCAARGGRRETTAGRARRCRRYPVYDRQPSVGRPVPDNGGLPVKGAGGDAGGAADGTLPPGDDGEGWSWHGFRP